MFAELAGVDKLTIFNVAILDLLQHLWPHACVHLLVHLDILVLELDDLGYSLALVLESVGWDAG